jgi:DNA-binding response OmpR family regulator
MPVPTILIVEDDPSITVSLEFLMQQKGYCVYIAGTGAEALELSTKYSPDLILMDVMLPSISGLEVCRQLKDRKGDKKPKIILLTAKGRIKDKQDGLSAGADAYVTKPFSTQKLLSAVDNLLRGLPIPENMD